MLQAFPHISTQYEISRSIGPLDIKLPQKEIISTNDRRSDGQTLFTTTIGSFFQKKKKILNSNDYCCTLAMEY